ncbi:hypothetical protein PENFLA_c009G07036 [Penicillium flavigenum]|uniref:Uncharacterized protein n=1 Tax=Penicillium flavigenum TaxID=254877 RepID=A0A1V6TEK1_9EURO|nr:hypothetical protein PENFLA_c009G07036 [Penicillium flavigenum]
MAWSNDKLRGSPLQTPGNVRIVVLIHVGGNAVSFEKWQLAPVNCTEATEASVEVGEFECRRKDDSLIPFLIHHVLIMAALAISNAADGKFYIPQTDPKFAGNTFEAPVNRVIDADAAAALQVLARAVLEYLGVPLEEAVEGTVPPIDTPHSTPAGLEPGEIHSAPRRNPHATLPAKRPRCKSPQYHDRHVRSYNPSPGPGSERQRQF